MTGQSLFYLGEGDLKHKILAIAEEEGVRQAAYALKLLQSQGELTIASTGKDPTTGKLVTTEYRVEGPVMLFLTTTAIDIDEELLNRCLVLTINESRASRPRRSMQRQRAARTLAGLLAQGAQRSRPAAHRAAQTLLRPLAVVNPYAEALTFRSDRTRMRRDHAEVPDADRCDCVAAPAPAAINARRVVARRSSTSRSRGTILRWRTGWPMRRARAHARRAAAADAARADGAG